MKLQTKINYRFLALLLIVFMVAGVVLYFVLGMAVNDSFDRSLRNRSRAFIQSVTQNTSSDLLTEMHDKSVIIKPTTHRDIPQQFTDTLIQDRSERDLDNYRKMVFVIESNGKPYEVTLLLSKYETEDLMELVFYFMLAFFAFIVLILFYLNRKLSASIWTPFYKTLDKIDALKMDSKNTVTFEDTDVYEFEQLNLTLRVMMQKMQSDFNNLKEFTENASHEIQTPIAIIKTKLENVLQDKTLDTHLHEQIRVVYESASRLSKLNEALLLLSKIENQQFPDSKETDLSDLVNQRLEYIEELVEFKKIEIIRDFQQPFITVMNGYLAEILINNLLGNAVRHNVEGGQITIVSSHDRLVISNTGKPLTVPAEKLFLRFAKQNAGNESTGLGLAIANEICTVSGLTLQYKYEEGMHRLSVTKRF